MICREHFRDWSPATFQINLNIPRDVEILYAAGADHGTPDYFLIGRYKGELFYTYHRAWYEGFFQKHLCDVAKLREWYNHKLDQDSKAKFQSGKGVIYWWRDDIKEFIDELERSERSGVPEGVGGTVEEA